MSTGPMYVIGSYSCGPNCASPQAFAKEILDEFKAFRREIAARKIVANDMTGKEDPAVELLQALTVLFGEE